MTSINVEEALALLKTDSNTRTDSGSLKPHVKPIQIGPLGWWDKPKTCVHRGCSKETLIMVNRVTYCHVHALYQLNLLMIKDQIDTTQCTCNTGRHSAFNMHTEDCPLFNVISKMREDSH